jgi:autotransporter-associated beta strand protein
MKNRRLLFGASIAVLLALLVLSPRASAQQFWDGPHNDNTTIEGGTGTWSNSESDVNWANAQGVGGNPYSENTPVIFSGATGIVTLGSNITLNSNSVSFSTDGYVINPNGFGFDIVTSATISVDNGLTATINAPIRGSGDSLTKGGAGTLILSGINTYGGGTNLNGGILAVNVDSNLGTGPLSFNGGTLEALAAGGGIMSNKGITLNVGGGTFLADAGTASTLIGPISGVGSFTKDGLGMLTLNGANTYSGGTNLNGGILAVNVDGNLGTGPLSFNGGVLEALAAGGGISSNKPVMLNPSGGTFLADPGTSSTLSGAITGEGAWTKTGSGTLILTGTNTYGGGTTISAGTLQLGNGGTTGSIPGNVTDNGVLAFNRSNVFTFGGVISGEGSVQQNGTGTTVLAGNNTYTGGTTINAGTLQLGNGGTSGNIVGNVINNGSLVFNRSDAFTFGGVISGTGSVQQNGLGTTVLGSDNSYRGTTTVNGGSLIVDGSIASVETVVNANGLLGGKGFVGGNVVSSGIVSPGDSPGTLHVSGDYTQNSNGTLRIEVAGTSPGQFDVLQVGGHASLGGTLQLIRLGNFQLQVGDKLTFLTAGRGVSGTFSTLENPFLSNTIIKAQITILPNAVELVGTQGSFTEAACNPNSLAVAKALDSAVGDPRAAALISFLNTQPLNQLCGDFELIAPEGMSSIYSSGFSVQNVQADNLNRRMSNVRAGSTGFSSAGFTMNGVTPSYSSGLAGPTGAEGKTGPSVLAPVPENRWGVFATGLGEFTHVAGTDGASGFNLQTGGVTVGVDYRIGSNFAVGLLAGYAHTNADLVNNGNLDVNSAKFGLYATAFTGGFYLNSAVTGGWSDYDSHRTALGGTASGSTDGGDFNVLVSGGYDWKTGNLSIGPTASFQYNYLSFNSFTESGSLAPLKYNDQDTDSIRTAFGMKATYDWKVGKVLVRPELRLAWQHEYGLSAYPIAAGFANGAGSSFTVSGPKIGRDSLLIGAGAAVIWNDRIATYIYYDGEVARTNYDSHNISGGIRITF